MASEVVSVAAALASIAAAGVAAWGAATASQRADGIDRRRHMIEAHDERVASFRAAHAAFMECLGVAGRGDTTLDRVGSLGPMISRAEVLVTHPLASEDMTKAVDGLAAAYTAGVVNLASAQVPVVQQHLDELRAAVRAIYASAADERAHMVDALTVSRWWRLRR